ncbi:MAG: adenosylcobinamide-phosphate synthase CbiB [Candidatus Methanoplasma sp.]|jgi:adenosylcobinamide-phosphate synthase|nr:adenosylcobinamide-phosphate synthase CbiB [Candidatus Methanoplasma sp.]
MELWADAVLIVAAAALIDRFAGEPPNRFHPLRWIGNTVGWLDRRVSDRASRANRLWGFLSYLGVFALFWTAAIALCAAARVCAPSYSVEAWGVSASLGEILWILASAAAFKLSFAVFSFRAHCAPIQRDLEAGDAEGAAAKVQMIVSRDTRGMDEGHIASSCCETVSENLVDSAISPAAFFGLLGITGAVMFRCANLMDAMWGYLNDRYRHLGFFPAKFDDVLGFATSRASPLFIAAAAYILRMDYRAAIPAAREGHRKTPSPNSGWPMTAAAAALGITMEKKGVYVMGAGPMPGTRDVTRCCRLVELSSLLFMFAVALPLFALVGIHAQLMAEDLLIGIAEAFA